MKNLNDHRKLANKLQNKFGYTCSARVNASVPYILMASEADAQEMSEVFEGYEFAYETK